MEYSAVQPNEDGTSAKVEGTNLQAHETCASAGIYTASNPRMLSNLLNYINLLILGAIAGLTILLGLPVAVMQKVSLRKKGFLNAFAIGILIFLIVDVFDHAWETAVETSTSAFSGSIPLSSAAVVLAAMFGGIAVGLLGLTWYGTNYMRTTKPQSSPYQVTSGSVAVKDGFGRQELQLIQQVEAYRVSMMIAIGIGAHNFSEGLAIGQSYASGAIGLALMLIIGFAAHNTTEGFGIAAPLTSLSKRPSNRFLFLAGLIGGGPTFIGTLLGSMWSSPAAYVFFLSLAGGALVYVTMLMYNSGRRQVTNDILMLGIFIGLIAGFLTDLLVSLAGA
jgi:ZIP family zinc transporter